MHSVEKKHVKQNVFSSILPIQYITYPYNVNFPHPLYIVPPCVYMALPYQSRCNQKFYCAPKQIFVAIGQFWNLAANYFIIPTRTICLRKAQTVCRLRIFVRRGDAFFLFCIFQLFQRESPTFSSYFHRFCTISAACVRFVENAQFPSLPFVPYSKNGTCLPLSVDKSGSNWYSYLSYTYPCALLL